MTDAPPSDAVPPGFAQIDWLGGFVGLIGPLYERNNPDGTYSRAFTVAKHHTNGMTSCHGGMLMSFADMAFGHAVSLKTQRFWVTVRLLMDFLSTAEIGDFVEGAGEIVGAEDDLFTIRGRVWTGGKTVMTGTGVFKALGARPARAATSA